MIGKCSNCDNQGSPFGKIHEEFEDRPVDELLAKIDTIEARYTDYPTYLALRAVVELHKPIVSNDRDGHTCLACSSELSVAYPCPTIQAIEKELG